MTEAEIRMQAQMYAIVAEMNSIIASIEGMKATNVERQNQGFALAYDESAFDGCRKELEALATKLRNDI